MSGLERLRHAAQLSGYGPSELEHAAIATLPGLTPGQQLTDAELTEVAGAVEILHVAALRPDALAATVRHYRSTFNEQWRIRFWSAQAHIAAARDCVAGGRPPAPVLAVRGLDTPVAAVELHQVPASAVA